MSQEKQGQEVASASSGPLPAGANPTSPSHGYEEAPTASSDLVWRAEIVKQLFGDVGEVITGFFLNLLLIRLIPN
jgi:hypothetical protein